MNRLLLARLSRQALVNSKSKMYSPISCTFLPSFSSSCVMRQFCSRPADMDSQTIPSTEAFVEEKEESSIAADDNAMRARLGDIVSIAYSFRNSDGDIVDQTEATNIDGDRFEVGSESSLKGLSKHALKMKEGESKSFRLVPAEAFGIADQALIYSLAWDQLPKGENFEVGDTIGVEDETLKQEKEGHVVRIVDEGIIVDCNHPLAGEPLDVKMKLLNIERA